MENVVEADRKIERRGRERKSKNEKRAESD